jgi:STAM-binding protein
MYADDIYDRPARPAKEPIPDRLDSFSAAPPPIPSKQVTFAASPQPLSSQSALRYTFQSSARTESGTPLRSIFLPSSLRWTFLKVAQSNTTRNLETCGILCGTLISNALFITHLIIPDQTSTSDTCDTTESGDNALFDYCDSHQLIVCGWIHTHPTQTCFLSSRDLHTCSGYQVMLPEAIAIVCAPKHSPDWGIFRLTDPPGLRHVLDCRQTGLFHPHSETNLYTDALRPGHVVEGDGLEFELVDMRP